MAAKRFLYETHCHTRISSLCGSITPEEMVALYLRRGYAGVVVTDHFINGNCPVRREMPDAPFDEQIHRYCESYRQVKAAAGGRLDVLFGFEYSYAGTDVLVYGWDEEKLASMPEIVEMDLRTFIRFANDNGALTVQAHPFREAGYIDHIRLYPDVQGIEIYNANRDERCNGLARTFCKAYGKIPFSGSDLHSAKQGALGGMSFPERAGTMETFVEMCRAGLGKCRRISGDL